MHQRIDGHGGTDAVPSGREPITMLAAAATADRTAVCSFPARYQKQVGAQQLRCHSDVWNRPFSLTGRSPTGGGVSQRWWCRSGCY